MPNNIPTKHENKLFRALQEKKINCIQHHKDYYVDKYGVTRHKTIDIFLPDDNIFIEVDGKHHITKPESIISDFNRDYFSFRNNYFTKHITNEAIDSHLDEIVNAIVVVVKNAPNKMGEKLLS